MPDTLVSVRNLHQMIEAYGRDIGPRIWPGFRPDTIPTLYVVANQGKVMMQWRHEPISGFVAVPGDSETSWSEQAMASFPSGNYISFMNVDSTMTRPYVLGTDIHEAFHSFEHSAVTEKSLFGQGENAMLISTYPVFDERNEALFSLEGESLGRALRASTLADAKQSAREFLALREKRRAGLSPDFAEFEAMAEMNEGLAQYALIRGMAELAGADSAWTSGARYLADAESSILDNLMGIEQRSVRRRFYATGSAMGLLLDRLVGDAWKQRLMNEKTTIEKVLAASVGFQGSAELGRAWNASVARRVSGRLPQARASIALLRARRRNQADSILANRGLSVVLDPALLASHHFGWCGFDPQNLLQTGDGRTIHMRFLNVCGGSVKTAQLNQAAVEDSVTGTISTVIAAEDKLVIEAGGETLALPDGFLREVTELRVQSSGFTMEAGSARLLVQNGSLHILVH
ncbi:MAG: hypothetical protein ABI613_02200 [Gemmatimonadota bacterium]